jgi:hypothetical protein
LALFELGGKVRVGTSGFVTGGDGAADVGVKMLRHLGVEGVVFEPGIDPPGSTRRRPGGSVMWAEGQRGVGTFAD